MSRESQSTDAAAFSSPVSRPYSLNRKNRFSVAIFGILALLYEFLSFAVQKLVNVSVIIGTVLHAKVVVPLTIGFVALAQGVAVALDRARLYSRYAIHAVSVSLSHLRAHRLFLIACVMSLTAFVIGSTFYGIGVKVFLDGAPVGYMNSTSDFNDAVSFVEKRASQILERPYSVASDIRFELDLVSRESIISKSELQNLFFSKIEEVSMLYALTVDGEVVGASTNRATLQGMLDELLYVNDSSVKAEFAQDVQISQRYVDASLLRSYEEIRQKLTSNIHEERIYTVKSGDTVDNIAKESGLTRADLLALNPGMRPNSLRVGQKLVTSARLPFLSVKAVRRVEYTQSIPFETKKVNNSSLYKGTTKVATQGRVGTTKIVADVTYVDNKETGRNVITSSVVSQPVSKVIYVGTKPKPSTAPTGSFRRPVRSAIITSNFGYRRSGFHSGVDFALPIGNPVLAADGGTVTYSGWKRGGWGYLVIISHGNGLETYYAHNSKLTVRVGQRVAKGEQIARVGSTGNSSGPHVHFEVHKNGRYVNPWRYIS